MSEENLTPEEREALQIMREIVAEKGADYVYPDEEKMETMCRYARYDGFGTPIAPSCIVGHYAVATGMSVADLEYHEGGIASMFLPHTGDRLLNAFDHAQNAQDNGLSWGEALAEFEHELGVRS